MSLLAVRAGGVDAAGGVEGAVGAEKEGAVKDVPTMMIMVVCSKCDHVGGVALVAEPSGLKTPPPPPVNPGPLKDQGATYAPKMPPPPCNEPGGRLDVRLAAASLVVSVVMLVAWLILEAGR